MDNIVPHITWIREWWHVVAGSALAVMWAVVRLLKTVFVTSEQLRIYHEESEAAHRRLEDKIDRNFNRIIEILLGKTHE